MAAMRLVMMGAGPFAAPTFQSLYDTTHEVLALVTRPPKPGPGGKQPLPSPLRAIAADHGAPIFEPQSINSPEAISLLKSLSADLFVVCDYGQILSAEALGAARLGGLNLHGSLLPRYRGAAPVHWAIYHGEKETGVTSIHMTVGLDAGPSLATRRTPIGDEETTPELEERLSVLGVEAVGEALEKLAGWDGSSPLGERQDPALATRAPKLKKDDGWIDWRRSAREIHNQVRAFQPWPGAFTVWTRPENRSGGQPLRIALEKVRVLDEATVARPTDPGAVIAREKAHLWIATGDGALSIERLQPAGKRVLEIGEFLRGYNIAVGDVLGPNSSSSAI